MSGANHIPDDVPVLDRTEVVGRYLVEDRSIPHLRVNFITSLDGAATHDGLSGGLNNADDKVVFDTLRMLADAIIVGAGTVRAEGYGGVELDEDAVTWRLAHGLESQPPVIIVSSRLDIEPSHPFFARAVTRPVVVTHAASPAGQREALAEVADVLICGAGAVDPAVMIEVLAARGYTQLLCEGGPHLFGTLIEADCVDELCLSVSPVIEGGSAGRIARGGAQASRSMKLLQAFPARDMVFLRYARKR
ncbi:pyrimidine reductase family protein [Leifsonia sp. A12D58]|uniref:pyrimidine reductase family protein n=1 Tax=Leifsonia sp. A12D58 TaxID=3397674 RepID=UPI0039E17EDD